MENTYTITDIVKQTGLKEKFIRSCVEALKDNVLKNSIKRGNKNSLLFDSNTLTIFDFIKQKYDSGYSISTIKQELIAGNLVKQNPKTQENTPKTDSIFTLVNDVRNLNETLLKAKDTILEKEKEIFVKETQILEQGHLISILKNNLKLITDGRTPEEVREAQIRKEEELKKHKEELSTVKEYLGKKDNEINVIKSLVDTKEQEIKNQKRQIEDIELSFKTKEKYLEEQKTEVENRVKQNETKRKELLKQLEELEGKWFVGGKRKDLLKQLQDLA